MTSPSNDFQDILNAMERDPALRGALRRHILTDELLQVPVRLERIEGYVGTLQEGVSTLTADATTLKEGQARLEQGRGELQQGQTELREDVRSANLRINQIAGDMGNLRGNEYERRIRFRVLYRAGAEFGIQGPDIALSQNDPRSPAFQQDISSAIAEGRITPRELEELGDSDFIIMGTNNRHAVVEASITASNNDITWARERAKILQKVTQGRAFAAVVATRVPQPQVILADSQNVAVLNIAFP